MHGTQKLTRNLNTEPLFSTRGFSINGKASFYSGTFYSAGASGDWTSPGLRHRHPPELTALTVSPKRLRPLPRRVAGAQRRQRRLDRLARLQQPRARLHQRSMDRRRHRTERRPLALPCRNEWTGMVSGQRLSAARLRVFCRCRRSRSRVEFHPARHPSLVPTPLGPQYQSQFPDTPRLRLFGPLHTGVTGIRKGCRGHAPNAKGLQTSTHRWIFYLPLPIR